MVQMGSLHLGAFDETDCLVLPVQGALPAEPGCDADGAGEPGDMMVYHGTSLKLVQRMLTAGRMIRGTRYVQNKFGVCAAERTAKAFEYSRPKHLIDGVLMQVVVRLRAFRMKKISDSPTSGRQFIMRERWCQIEALLFRPWRLLRAPRAVDYYAAGVEWEACTVKPIRDAPFFGTWCEPPADFWAEQVWVWKSGSSSPFRWQRVGARGTEADAAVAVGEGERPCKMPRGSVGRLQAPEPAPQQQPSASGGLPPGPGSD